VVPHHLDHLVSLNFVFLKVGTANRLSGNTIVMSSEHMMSMLSSVTCRFSVEFAWTYFLYLDLCPTGSTNTCVPVLCKSFNIR